MDGAVELISRVRDHYVQQYLAFIDAQRNQWPSGVAEVKFEIPEKSELFRKLYCVDFIAKEGDEVVVREMLPDRILKFGTLSLEIREAQVVIEQLVWDDVQLHHDAVAFDIGRVGRWFDHWFDPDDARLDPNAELGGVVHSLMVKGNEISLDLGSAAPEAFWDMLEVVAGSGATTMRVTSWRETESA